MNARVARSPFHVLAKPIGAICNLHCRYCFYLKKEALFDRPRSFRMNEGVLESFIRQYIEGQPEDAKEVDFAWQGGEPTLLGVGFFRMVARLQEMHRRPGMKILNSFQTNGVLLNDEWGEFLVEHDYLVGISIDGPEHLHDRYRLNKEGKGTFHDVMQGVEILKKHKVEFNTLTCIHRHNSYHAKEVYEFLKEIGSQYFQFIPIVEINPDCSISPWTVEPKQYGRFLSKVFDRWLQKKDVGNVFIRDFDNLLGQLLDYPAPLCVTAETCGRAVAIEHNGNLYSCDHFVNPEDLLGNVLEDSLVEMIDGEKQTRFGNDKRDTLPRDCKECGFLDVCNGGCPKDRIMTTPAGEAGLDYLCDGRKVFYAHVMPVFLKMAECLRTGRPASDYEQINRLGNCPRTDERARHQQMQKQGTSPLC